MTDDLSRWKPSVCFQDQSEIPFNVCVVKSLQGDVSKDDDVFTHVRYSYEDGQLCLSTSTQSDVQCVKLYHPHTCPMMTLNGSFTPQECKRISVGSVAAVISADGFLLLTRRPKKLRTFPGVWVVPGGHIEKGEKLLEAGLRELQEEVGIHLMKDDYKSHLLCLFESCYPAFNELGDPQRHHLVFYYLFETSFTRDQLDDRLELLEEEVDASVWLSESEINDIVNEEYDSLPTTFRQRNIIGGKTSFSNADMKVFCTSARGQADGVERLSQGTLVAMTCYVERLQRNAKSN